MTALPEGTPVRADAVSAAPEGAGASCGKAPGRTPGEGGRPSTPEVA
ncbi:hypothetical protein HUT16_16405 [Kitasatospora sp. NA04385]|nr:hypothetical protein [Kitasatospora sp. NA04385]QKW20439.1 hypothetical protein HUT16_16405 [Kitasatospora sp. NA04385]